jgi:4-amino-4-deoxy-L-arabinose transferase-like glycosyltransferase
MSVIAAAGRARAPLERLLRALEDPARRDRTALILIAAYVVVWALYGVIAKSSQDIHFDMAEAFAWSRHLALGYPKHPPLAAWEAALWFALFPRADWAFYLLAMVNVGVAFWAAWRIATRVLDPPRCALALPLLSLIPLLNFQALKFTPNVVLIPTWALTTLFLLRSLETRRPLDAALAGIAAAAAMLGKYWSIYLLVGLAIAALCDPRRRAYFGSAAPWITIAAGFAVLAPHLAWLFAHDFAPISYAAETYGGTGFADSLRTAALYVVGAAAYVAPSVLLGRMALRAQPGATADTIWPPAGERRTLALAFWLPLLLPAAVTLVSGGRTTPLWTMCNWTPLPMVLLSSPRFEPRPRAVTNVIACALIWPLVLLAASPFIAFAIHRAGVPHSAANYRLLAAAIERAWQASTGAPLRIVGGDSDLAYGAAFYLPDPQLVFAHMDRKLAPWLDAGTVKHDGVALVCPLDNPPCVHDIETFAGQRGAVRRSDVELARRYFGTPGPAERFVIVTVPPQP